MRDGNPPAVVASWRAAAIVLALLAMMNAEVRAQESDALSATSPAAVSQRCTLEPGPRRSVVRVLDAETIELDDGTQVRLIGALAPRQPATTSTALAPDETANAGEATFWPPEREAKAALEALVVGHTVELAYGGRRQDRYGRTLAHVFRIDGATRSWVQGEMLAQGHARAYGLPQSYLCMDELIAHERLARDAGLALWATAAYAPRTATDLAALRRARNTYQLVVGRVVSIRRTKSTTYLNFGADWRRTFSVVARHKSLAAAERSRLSALEGKTVLVRGWVERRGGPFIAIEDISQLEVLADGTTPDDVSRAAAPPPTVGDAGAGAVSATGDSAPTRPTRSAKRKRPARSAPGAVDL